MKRTVIAALALLCTMVQGAWAADISNAIVYNPWRFLPYDGYDSYDIYAETIEVYFYDNGLKWTETDSPISNPCFNGVTVTALSPKSTDCGVVTFQGIYSPLNIDEADKTKLYLGSNSTLFYPNAAMSINAFRAFFQLNGITAGDLKQGAKNIVLNFGDDATTALTLGSQIPSAGDNDVYYDLQGRRVSGSSTLPKGIYIHKGKKIIK